MVALLDALKIFIVERVVGGSGSVFLLVHIGLLLLVRLNSHHMKLLVTY